MKPSVRFLGHSVHQMLVPFPLGALGISAVFDIIGLVAGDASWHGFAYWAVAAGLIGGAIAAPFGLADWVALPRGTRARRIGAIHGLGNAVVLVLFAAGWLMRGPGEEPGILALCCSFLGVGLSLATAWLGGELVSRLGVGVYENAGPNAPSSLRES